MSGPSSFLRVSRSFLLSSALVAAPVQAAPTLSPTPRAGPPIALRTEIVLDRTTLEALRVPNPSQIAFDPAGNLYVLDASSRRVVKLDPRGTLLFDLGGYGTDEASFSLPSDLIVDRRETLLVLDRGKSAVIAFDPAGHFLGDRAVGDDVASEAFAPEARLLIDPFGALWLLAVRERDLIPLDDQLQRARTSRYLAPEESLGTAAAATFLPSGDVWAFDGRSIALRHFGSSGRLLRTVSLADSTGAARVSALASDPDGYVYAADPGEQRILVYDADGRLLLSRALGGNESRWKPASIAVGRSDRLAIADPERGEIQILSIERAASP